MKISISFDLNGFRGNAGLVGVYLVVAGSVHIFLGNPPVDEEIMRLMNGALIVALGLVIMLVVSTGISIKFGKLKTMPTWIKILIIAVVIVALLAIAFGLFYYYHYDK